MTIYIYIFIPVARQKTRPHLKSEADPLTARRPITCRHRQTEVTAEHLFSAFPILAKREGGVGHMAFDPGSAVAIAETAE